MGTYKLKWEERFLQGETVTLTKKSKEIALSKLGNSTKSRAEDPCRTSLTWRSVLDLNCERKVGTWGYKESKLYDKPSKISEQGNNIISTLLWGG